MLWAVWGSSRLHCTKRILLHVWALLWLIFNTMSYLFTGNLCNKHEGDELNPKNFCWPSVYKGQLLFELERGGLYLALNHDDQLWPEHRPSWGHQVHASATLQELYQVRTFHKYLLFGPLKIALLVWTALCIWTSNSSMNLPCLSNSTRASSSYTLAFSSLFSAISACTIGCSLLRGSYINPKQKFVSLLSMPFAYCQRCLRKCLSYHLRLSEHCTKWKENSALNHPRSCTLMCHACSIKSRYYTISPVKPPFLSKIYNLLERAPT